MILLVAVCYSYVVGYGMPPVIEANNITGIKTYNRRGGIPAVMGFCFWEHIMIMYESMVFYRSFYDAIKGLDPEMQAEVYNAVFAYGLYGETLDMSPIANTIFTLIKPQIDANNKRRENGKKGAEYGKLGGRPKKDNGGKTATKPLKNPEATPNVNENVNVNVNDNNKRFVPPTVDEVAAYCKERNNGIDAKAFVAFYESKGWLIGKNKMKNWKSAVQTWERRNDKPASKPKDKGFNQRKYDFAELEKEAFS